MLILYHTRPDWYILEHIPYMQYTIHSGCFKETLRGKLSAAIIYNVLYYNDFAIYITLYISAIMFIVL